MTFYFTLSLCAFPTGFLASPAFHVLGIQTSSSALIFQSSSVNLTRSTSLFSSCFLPCRPGFLPASASLCSASLLSADNRKILCRPHTMIGLTDCLKKSSADACICPAGFYLFLLLPSPSLEPHSVISQEIRYLASLQPPHITGCLEHHPSVCCCPSNLGIKAPLSLARFIMDVSHTEMCFFSAHKCWLLGFQLQRAEVKAVVHGVIKQFSRGLSPLLPLHTDCLFVNI